MFYRTLRQKIDETEDLRKRRKRKIERIQMEGFQELDHKYDRLTLVDRATSDCFLTFRRRTVNSILSIFLTFVPTNLVTQILQNDEVRTMILAYSKYWSYSPSLKDIYLLLAISIRIQGLQNKPLRNSINTRPLRAAIKEARSHFQGLLGCDIFPGINVLERLMAIPLLREEYYDDICKNFQKFVLRVGERVCGDEKLFHFTGKSRDLRLVPRKPARIGFWYYELCVPLPYGGVYLLHTRLAKGEEGLPISEVIQWWCHVVKQFPNDSPLLTMDSYYLDNASKAILEKEKVNYVAAFSANKFALVRECMEGKVHNPGEWCGMHDPKTRVSIVYHWSPDVEIGKKWVMSNACELTHGTFMDDQVQLYQLYKETFAECDHFNLSLRDRMWPHRKGGRNRYGARNAS